MIVFTDLRKWFRWHFLHFFIFDLRHTRYTGPVRAVNSGVSPAMALWALATLGHVAAMYVVGLAMIGGSLLMPAYRAWFIVVGCLYMVLLFLRLILGVLSLLDVLDERAG